jgi:peroxiredoxin
MKPKRMRFFLITALFAATLSAAEESDAAKLWNDLAAKRAQLTGFHQEFTFSRTMRLVPQDDRVWKGRILVDASQNKWRWQSLGANDHVMFFDGENRFLLEDGFQEYVREKGADDPLPYKINNPDWRKAAEIDRGPCTVAGNRHTCVTLRVPLLNGWILWDFAYKPIRMLEGEERVLLDLDTGLLATARVVQLMVSSSSRPVRYTTDTTYTLKSLNIGPLTAKGLFELPSDSMHSVPGLSEWNAKRMRKELVGKAAPDFTATDLSGQLVSLASYRGKPVLLDFWATWCTPCRTDGSSLDKLQRKYGGKDLAIVGISVDEVPEVVKKFLAKYPHEFPVVMTSENEFPRPYQVNVIPTYVVIDADGKITSVEEGDKGFAELRRRLQAAGLSE